jgi:hypothetical protein
MLRILIIAALLYGAYYLATSLTSEYKRAEVRSGNAPPPPSNTAAADLPGMPPQLAASLQAAEQSGPATLKKWIAANRRYLADPRLGDIELDYAVAIARVNTAEARATFKSVKDRTPSDSPLQARLQRLSRSFE